MKTLAILQARMGSTRLPGKVLADVHGRPMLQWLLERIAAVPEIDELVVATTREAADDELARWLAGRSGVQCFRGDTDDVLARFFHAAAGRGSDLIVRLTGDDPLKDPGLISQTIRVLQDDPAVDYASTSLRPSYPEGLDVEVLRTRVLECAFHEARLPSEREHVTPYVWKNPQRFRLHSVEQARDLSAWRWTVDKPADLEFVRALCAPFKDRPLVPWEELAAYIEAHPQVAAINDGTLRNEGYLKSLAREQT